MFKMKKNLALMLVLIIVSVFGVNCLVLDAYAQSKPIDYTIKKSDTLFYLARRFNTTEKNITSINPPLVPENLAIGSKIKIPPGDGITVHIVKKGDSLWKIAKEYRRKYNSTLSTRDWVYMITSKNLFLYPNKNEDLIYEGDVLAIPTQGNEVIWVNGWIWDGLYNEAYAIYKVKTDKELDAMIKELESRMSQIVLTGVFGDPEGPNADMSVQTVKKYKSTFGIDDTGLARGYVYEWIFQTRMGMGWGYYPNVLFETTRAEIGQSNLIPVDTAKMAKALYVRLLQYTLGD